MKASQKTYDVQSEHSAFHIYESIKIVKAAQVTGILPFGLSDAARSVVVGGPNNCKVVAYDFANRPVPRVGDWCIMYADGYISFCPHDSFLGGYQLLGSQGEVIMPSASDLHMSSALREVRDTETVARGGSVQGGKQGEMTRSVKGQA